MSIESRETRPTQFTSNGHVEHYALPPEDRRRFENVVRQLPPPDIDRAKEILPRAVEIYKTLGVSPVQGKRLTQTLETRLYGGTAPEQRKASEVLLSLNQGYEGYIRAKRAVDEQKKMAGPPAELQKSAGDLKNI